MARIIEGGEIAGINGFMHMIDNVLIYEPDLRAVACAIAPLDYLLILCLILSCFANRYRVFTILYFICVIMLL